MGETRTARAKRVERWCGFGVARAAVLCAAVGVIAALLGAGEVSGATGDRMTIKVSNTEPISVTHPMVLDPTHQYRLRAEDRISDWPDAPEDGFGVDAVWCYAVWRCGGSGMQWRQLRVKRAADEWGSTWGQGFDEFAGKVLPYERSHVYTVKVSGVEGQLEFATWDAFVFRSHEGNKGAFKVTITDLGPEKCRKPKAPDPEKECIFLEYRFGGFVPGLGKNLVGESLVNGRGRISGAKNDNRLLTGPATRSLNYRACARWVKLRGQRILCRKWGRYRLVVLHGFRYVDQKHPRIGNVRLKALKLKVQVVSSNNKKCPVGRKGTIEIIQNHAMTRNGRLTDALRSTICGEGISYKRNVDVKISKGWSLG